MRKVIIALSILLVTNFAVQSHSDMGKYYIYGKVNSMISWGLSEHEERNKAVMICMLADSLLEVHHFKSRINLGFTHTYLEKSSEDFSLSLVSYDKEPPSIKVALKSYRYDVEKLLKLLEFAILNVKELKNREDNRDTLIVGDFKEIITNKGAFVKRKSYRITKMSNFFVDSVLKIPTSIDVKNVLSRKVYRPTDNETPGYYSISYYLQNDQYFIYHQVIMNGKTYNLDVMRLENIYQFVPNYSYSRAMVFDTDSSFYFLNFFNAKSISTRQILPTIKMKYYPYNVTFPSPTIVSFSRKDLINNRGIVDRNFIYRIEDDYLVSDIDNVINQLKEK